MMRFSSNMIATLVFKLGIKINNPQFGLYTFNIMIIATEMKFVLFLVLVYGVSVDGKYKGRNETLCALWESLYNM